MVVRLVRQVFAPLTLALQSRAAARTLIEDLGWTLDEQFELDALDVLGPVANELTAMIELVIAVEAGTREPGEVVEELADMVDVIFVAIEDLQDMASGDITNLAAPMNTAEFWEEFALDLPEYLIITYLQTYLPLVFALFDLGGVFGTEVRLAGRPPRRTIDWQALGQLFSNPGQHLQDTYEWGGQLDHALLMPRLRELMWALNISGELSDVPDSIASSRFSPASGAAAVNTLKMPLFSATGSGGGLSASGRLDGILVPVPRGGAAPSGLLLTLEMLGQVQHELDLGGGWRLAGAASMDASGLLGIEVQPDGLSVPAAMPQGEAGLSLIAAPPEPAILVGKSDGSRLQLGRFEAGTGVVIGGGQPSFTVDVDLQDLELVVSAGDGDGFIADILGDLELIIPMELGLHWSKETGIVISGGVGFDIEIVIGKTVGPLTIETVILRFMAGSDGAELMAATTGGLKIGPFSAVVTEIGFKLTLEPQPRGARNGKGAMAVKAAFKPPSGIGLSVDAPGVGGGGFLEIFPEEGRYNGIVNLKFLGLEITAIALIATQMPDGSDGWSMFLSLSVQFGAGIQLGFGFKLTGVGGLVGVHRGIDIEALGDGVRTGALEAVLFPEDPVGNAPMILNALDTIFPIQRGQFVFGPIFQLGWGTPTLVTIQLGLAIQLPSPLTISLLGSISIRIAQDDLALIDITIDIAGTLWPTEGRLAIDSSIRRGKIAFLNLSGDMSLRAQFGGSNPSFLVANGGFHPHFTPPDGFPTLRRLSLKIIDEENLRIGVEAYLALGSNTLQFGVAAFFFAKALGFKAEGRFEFDTLIIFKPFGLTANLSFMIAVSAGRINLLSIMLRGTLKGPQPWIVNGYAEFRAFGSKQEFAVEMTIGQALSNPPRETVDLFDDMLAALRDASAWSAAQLDPKVEALVSVDMPEEGLYVHPVGRVQVTQTLAPLNIRLEKLGEDLIRTDETSISLKFARFDNKTALGVVQRDWFSPSHYFEMDDEEKLTAPSFEELEAGLLIGEVLPSFEEADAFELSYESKYRDPDADAEYPHGVLLRDGYEEERSNETQDPQSPRLFTFGNLQVRGQLAESRSAAGSFSVDAVQQTTLTDGAELKASWSAARASGVNRSVRPVYELELEGGT